MHLIPYYSSVDSYIWRFTVSNAFDMSKNAEKSILF